MACSPSAVFLLDTASPGQRERLQLCALRLLNHLCCRFGLPRLRWAYRFFDSLGGRGGASRGGGFRPPAPRAWARFEEELAERLGARGSSAVLPGPATRLALTHSGLKETLLDFQWDRPEIASPTKAPRRSRGAGGELPASGAPSEGFVNAVFLFSPCPRSRRELRQFVSGGGAAPAEPPALQEVAEKLLPRSVRELLAEQRITLYWVDTAESSQLIKSPDHDGYWIMLQLLQQIGGTILPSETLCLSHHKADLADVFLRDSGSPVPRTVPWTTLLPSDSALNSLFSKPSVFYSVFPQQEGTLFLSMPEGKKESCAVILEPLAMSQRQLRCPFNIILKGSVMSWNWMQAVSFLTESWILKSSETECTEQNWLHQLLRSLVMKELHMIAEVSQTISSNTTSPSPLEAEVPLTPPKLKGKTTPDAIKDWPRRKRAVSSTANSSCVQSEKNADEAMSTSREGKLKDLENCSSKVTCAFGEFELEGIYRLQDQVSPNDTEPRDEERSAMGASGLTSRKRVFTYLSPEKEENHEAKRACTDKCNMVLNAFSPEEGNRNKARTDLVLPEKPRACLLLTPRQHICIGDDDVFPLSDEESDDPEVITNQELSPFHSMASRRRSLSRTYSRKRLLS